MALTPERIDELAEYHGLDFTVYEPFARAIEAEVRKDDTALIRQLLEAAALPSMKTEAMLRQRDEAITAARARLEQPCG